MLGRYILKKSNIDAHVVANGIKRFDIIPSIVNVTLVGSVQNDPYFACYSSVDERRAA